MTLTIAVTGDLQFRAAHLPVLFCDVLVTFDAITITSRWVILSDASEYQAEKLAQ